MTVTKLKPGDVWLVEVDAKGQTRKAIAYSSLNADLSPGDEVLVNTTAVDLKLGTGGYDFIVANLSSPILESHSPGAHIMKLRYTPMQHAVNCVEESVGFREGQDFDVADMPVVAASLHSQVPIITAGIKAVRPKANIVYIMTDSAALSAGFSDIIRLMLSSNLVSEVITCGQAFGGTCEAVNVYSAIVASRINFGADVVIVCQGPGNTGTQTSLGFSGLDAAITLNAAYALGGQPVAAVRMSVSDSRARHHLVSHHWITILSKAVLAPCLVPLPKTDDLVMHDIIRQLDAFGISGKHNIKVFSGDLGIAYLKENEITIKSMGRGYDDDPIFFLSAAAAGAAAASLII